MITFVFFSPGFPIRGVAQRCEELPRNVSHDVTATAPRLRSLLPAVQRLVQQPQHGSAALRREEAQEERHQSRSAGAAGPDPGHGGNERYGRLSKFLSTSTKTVQSQTQEKLTFKVHDPAEMLPNKSTYLCVEKKGCIILCPSFPLSARMPILVLEVTKYKSASP